MRFLLLLLPLLGACSGTRRSYPETYSPDVPETLQLPKVQEKPLPSREEWFRRLSTSSPLEIDLVEAATVVANRRTKQEHPYSSIPSALSLPVAKARAQLQNDSDPEHIVSTLNQVALPEFPELLKGDLAWLRKSLGDEGGLCLQLSLLYYLCAKELGLELDFGLPPKHAFLCYTRAGKRRIIETTLNGADLPTERYREWLSASPRLDALAEDPAAFEKIFVVRPKRHFVSALLCQLRPSGDAQDRQDVEDAAALSPDSSIGLSKLAGFHALNKNYARAESLITQAIQTAPADPRLLAFRAMLHHAQEHHSSAMSDINEALALSPHHAWYHSLRALYLRELDKIHEAVAADTRSIELDPKDPDPWRDRGLLNLLLKEYRKSVEDLTRSIELDPDNEDSFTFRARSWAMLGDEKSYDADLERSKQLREKAAPPRER